MLKSKSFAKKTIVGLLSATLLVPTHAIFASELGSSQSISATAASTIFKELGPVEELGRPIAQLTVFDGVGGKYNGDDYLYITSTGKPAVFNVYNITTGVVEHSIEIPGGATVWAQQIDPLTGDVYIASTGEKTLFRYKPGTSIIETVATGGNIKGQIWALTADDEGNIYGGMYQPGGIIKYNPETNQVEDWGTIKEGHDYVRSIAYHDGYIYAGLGARGGLVKIDKNDPTNKVEIPLKQLAAQKEGEDHPFLYSLDARGNYLFAHFQGNNHASYMIYDLVDEAWLDIEMKVAPGLQVSEVKDNKVYFNSENEVVYFDMDTEEVISTDIENPSSFRAGFWAQPQGYDHDVLVNVAYGGSVIYIDIENQTRVVESPMFLGGGLDIHTLETGEDGKLYMTGYTGAIGKAYDPANNAWQQFGMGQSESIGVSGSKVYFGEYPHAQIYMLDTADSSMEKPVKILEVGEQQDRPYVNTFGDGYAFFGHIPTYGENGGALAIFEEENPEETLRVYRNIVQDQSIVGLAYKDGIIYGSTSVHGGLDSKIITDPAKLFTFDVETGEKLDEWELDIPGYNGYISFISGLTFDEDGLLWAVANGYIVAINPETKEIVKYKGVFPDVSNYGKWRPVHVRFHDGVIYTDMYGQMVLVDPNTMEHNDLGISTVLFSLDQEGSLYYAQGATLYKRTVTDMEFIPAGKLNMSAPNRVGLSDEFSVKINTVNAYSLNSGDVKISFDSSLLEVVSVEAGSALAENAFVTYKTSGDELQILFSETGASSGVNGNVEVLDITFRAKGEISTAIFTLQADSAVGATHVISSNLLYPLGEAKLATTLIRDTLDVTGDGEVTISDLIATSKRVGTNQLQYDVNLDGVVDELDVQAISLRLLADRK